MFCALLGQDIRWAFTGPLVLWFDNMNQIDNVNQMTKLLNNNSFLKESNIKICRCAKGDTNLRFASVNITIHTPINHDIMLVKHNACILLFYFTIESTAVIK